ncbi:MAG: hypothetical protein FH756_01130 [Firmicutes bacterium]|nr:hypothetical protein [Bacillota bacterium]
MNRFCKTNNWFLVLFFYLLTLALTGCGQDYIDKVHNLIFFKGEGNKWEATIIVEPTEIWGEDERGSITHESTSGRSFLLTYKEDDFGNIIVTNYEYRDTAGMGEENDGPMKLNSFGSIAEPGVSGRNRAFFRDHDVITVTVDWRDSNGNHQETFKLRAVNKENPPKKLERYLRSN